MWLRLFISLSLLALIYGRCVITSNATGPPQQALGDDTIPKVHDWTTDPPACPEFQNKVSCCSDLGNSILNANFAKLQTAFGDQGGGCDICAANMKRFFCYFTCDPNVGDYMNFTDYRWVDVYNSTTDTTNLTLVTHLDLAMNPDHACGIYQSCSKITFLSEISAGNSALGLISFMFDRGMETSWTQVNVTMAGNNQPGMKFNTTPHMCNETFPTGFDEFGYPIPAKNCSCNYCSDSCQPLDLITYGSLTDGFKFGNVILAYMFAILLTIACMFVKRFRKQKTILNSNPNIRRNLLESENEPSSHD